MKQILKISLLLLTSLFLFNSCDELDGLTIEKTWKLVPEHELETSVEHYIILDKGTIKYAQNASNYTHNLNLPEYDDWLVIINSAPYNLEISGEDSGKIRTALTEYPENEPAEEKDILYFELTTESVKIEYIIDGPNGPYPMTANFKADSKKHKIITMEELRKISEDKRK